MRMIEIVFLAANMRLFKKNSFIMCVPAFPGNVRSMEWFLFSSFAVTFAKLPK